VAFVNRTKVGGKGNGRRRDGRFCFVYTFKLIARPSAYPQSVNDVKDIVIYVPGCFDIYLKICNEKSCHIFVYIPLSGLHYGQEYCGEKKTKESK
jgi:hypothetical protein